MCVFLQKVGVNMPEIDSLEIKIVSTAEEANKELKKMATNLNNVSKKLKLAGDSASGNFGNINNEISKVNSKFKTATTKVKSFTGSFSRMYAAVNVAKKAFQGLKKAITESSNYIESLDYFTNAFEQVAEKAVLQWDEMGYQSAEAYYNSFSERAKELTAKMTGFYPDSSGNLISTGELSLGINPSSLMQYQAMFAQMSSSIGVTSENALKLSNALTMIGADLASVKNMEFEDVWQNISSGLVGGTRAVDKYGINIRNVNLQQKLYELGIDATIQSLNQQDKALLRSIIMLDSTRFAWGNLANTINTPANQFRLLASNVKNLAKIIGDLFLPVVAKVLPYINGLVIALQRLFVWIGSLMGIDLSDILGGTGGGVDNTGIGDILDDTGEIAENIDNAADSAKKFKKQLQGFDRLNVISSQEDKDSGSDEMPQYDIGSALSGAFDDIYNEYLEAWQKAFDEMENRAQEIADKIQAFALKIWNFIEPLRTAVKLLWEEGLSKLANFVWTALEDFYNEFLVPIGKWAFGTEDKGITKFITIINDLLNNIDWESLNSALKDLWTALEPFAEKIGDGLNWFFENVLSPIAQFLINSVLVGAIKILADAFRILSKFIEFLIPPLSALWEYFLQPTLTVALELLALAIEVLVAAIDGIYNAIKDIDVDKFWSDLFNVSWAMDLFNKMFESFKKISLEQDWLGIGIDILEGIISGFLGAVAFIIQPIHNLFTMIFEGICSVFGIASPAKNMMPLGEYILLGIVEGFTSKVTAFTEAISAWYTGSVQPWFTKERWSTLYENIKASLTEKWNSLVSWWKSNGVSKWYNSSVKSWFTKSKWNFSGIKEGLSQAFNDAVAALKGIWEKFKEWIKDKLSFDFTFNTPDGSSTTSDSDTGTTKTKSYRANVPSTAGLYTANRVSFAGAYGGSSVSSGMGNTDFERAVETAVSRVLAPYLAEIARNTRETADKELTITERAVGKAVQNQNRQKVTRTGRDLFGRKVSN